MQKYHKLKWWEDRILVWWWQCSCSLIEPTFLNKTPGSCLQIRPRHFIITHVLHTRQSMFALWTNFCSSSPHIGSHAELRGVASYKLHISSFACRSYISQPTKSTWRSHSWKNWRRAYIRMIEHLTSYIGMMEHLTSYIGMMEHLTSGWSSIRKNYPSNRAVWVLLKQHMFSVDIVVVLMICIFLQFSKQDKSMDGHIYEGEADIVAWKIAKFATNKRCTYFHFSRLKVNGWTQI